MRNSSVTHFFIGKGKIEALVQASTLYKVNIGIKGVGDKRWKSILANCSGEIDSVVEILQGKLSSSVMKTIADKQKGLFPHFASEFCLKTHHLSGWQKSG